jgi:3-hydroxy-9,10-secoandrosta-1,3,5(10)-triene-9,17-dione monooxygenase
MPVGKVQRVEGGFKLSGRWGFSSGSDHCQWAFLGAFVPPAEGSKRPDMRTFLVPRSDYRIDDTWHVSGLRATGSNDVVVEDAFVPEHRTHRFSDGFMCKSPGQSLNTGALFSIPFGQLFVRSVSTPSIGMATGALRAYREIMKERVSRADGAKGCEDPAGQRAAARAEATIDRVKLVLMRNFDQMIEAAREGRTLEVDERVKWRYESAMAVSDCVEVVRELFSVSGSRSIFLDSPMNGYFQDIHACRAHYANNPEKPSQNYGRVQFGMRNQDFFI